jgi:hypothetical protein
MSAAVIELSELCIHGGIGPRIMAAVTGYFDDSRTNGRLLTIAGFVGDEYQWKMFGKLWNDILNIYGVPYSHMKELGDPEGPYKKWHPLWMHQEDIESFLNLLAWAIGNSRIVGFGSTVYLDDLQRVQADNGITIEPYALAAYGCARWVGREYRNDIASLVFDRCDKVSKRLEIATQYADSARDSSITERLQLIPLHKSLTARDVHAMQAADFVAWEHRREHLRIKDWFILNGSPEELTEPLRHIFERERVTKCRKSINALAYHGVTLSGIIWNYATISHENKIRAGVWAPSSEIVPERDVGGLIYQKPRQIRRGFLSRLLPWLFR